MAGIGEAGVEGYSSSAGGYGVFGYDSQNEGVHGGGNVGVVGDGVTGVSAVGATTGVYSVSNATNGFGVVGYGQQTSGSTRGVYGQSDSPNGHGVEGYSGSGVGVYGASTSGYAGYFSGNVHVQGTLSKTAGSFQIDHPLDPANKYLFHSFVESPDMKNIYDGIATLDARGEAWVDLPDYFDALNKDFRYQLTAIGAPALSLYIADEIARQPLPHRGRPIRAAHFLAGHRHAQGRLCAGTPHPGRGRQAGG